MADFTDSLVLSPTALPSLVLLAASDQGPADTSDHLVLSPGALTEILVAWSDQGPSDVANEHVFFTSTSLDAVAPILANFSPTASSTLAKFDPISFDVTDVFVSGGALAVQIAVYIVSTDTTELAWNGEVWENQYASVGNASTYTAITNGYHFVLRRRGGWPSGGVRIKIRALDSGGNVGTL